MEFDHEIWVPITLFIAIAVTVSLYFYFKSRMRHDLQLTVRAAIDKGQELTPEVLDRLGKQRPGPNADLRRAVVLVALGAAFASFGALVGDQDAIRPFLAMGAFPFILGIAYFGLWRFTDR